MLSDKQWDAIWQQGVLAVVLALGFLLIYKRGWPMLAAYIKGMEERAARRDEEAARIREADAAFLRETVIHGRTMADLREKKMDTIVSDFQMVITKVSNRLDDMGDSLRILADKPPHKK